MSGPGEDEFEVDGVAGLMFSPSAPRRHHDANSPNPPTLVSLPLVAGDPMPGVVIYLTCTFAGAAMAAGAYYLTNPDEVRMG